MMATQQEERIKEAKNHHKLMCNQQAAYSDAKTNSDSIEGNKQASDQIREQTPKKQQSQQPNIDILSSTDEKHQPVPQNTKETMHKAMQLSNEEAKLLLASLKKSGENMPEVWRFKDVDAGGEYDFENFQDDTQPFDPECEA
eukprot:50141_1